MQKPQVKSIQPRGENPHLKRPATLDAAVIRSAYVYGDMRQQKRVEEFGAHSRLGLARLGAKILMRKS